ncbi:MAG: glycosyltransferase family 2 protein [Burkholderiales bacterium]|jgi:glycosyltransferase involved in cell wall biosynthesis|nr:glycosyltransferase family 2 protein [Burkholderiales bacterium]
MQPSKHRIAAIIPCYKVTRHILKVLGAIDSRVWRIYAVDDACPEKSGALVEAQCRDPRVKVLYHERNKGVGGAVISGYRAAIADGATVLVKIDGDGQMSPALLPDFVMPILTGAADYTKGNRFYDLAKIKQMPRGRIFGNAALSLFAKLSTGYWDLFDPTNGYTAIHAEVARRLPLERISERYFFESDMLFRLGTFRAVVVDVPMDACYGDEVSNLRVRDIFWEFSWKLTRNFFKRIFYNYFLRDVSLASLELLLGVILVVFGGVYGACHWAHSAALGVTTPAGTVVVAAVSLLVGLQLLLAFLGYDIANVPRRPLHHFFMAGAEWRHDKNNDEDI